MSQPDSDQPVTVTAEERIHPALRKLARAAVLLARQQLSDKKPTAVETGATNSYAQGAPEGVSGQEVTHD